jgi:hypothetical protein
MEDVLIGFVSDTLIFTDKKFRIVMIKNAFDVLGALIAIVVGSVKVRNFLFCRFEVRRRAQDFVDKRGGMKKRKTFVLRSPVIPC